MKIKRFYLHYLVASFFIFSMGMTTAGCASKTFQLENVLGSPDHHVMSGIKMLKKGRLDVAQREFEYALEDDPACAAAHRGMALIHGMNIDFKLAFESITRAIADSKENEEELMTHSQLDLLQIRKAGDRGPARRERGLQQARAFIKDFLDEYFHTGLQYRFGTHSEAADDHLKKMLEVSKAFILEAERQIKQLYKMDKTGP